MTNQVVCVTGHRPQKLGGFSEEIFLLLTRLAVNCLTRLKPKLVITGMALGWDQAVAQGCKELGIPYKPYIPFKGQELMWKPEAQERYHSLLQGVEARYVNPPGFAGWKMIARNNAMVDDSEVVLALYNKDKHGGTFRCVEYAHEQGRTVLNCWDRWVSRDF